ncbi:hypothetical protein F4814DRAFT_210462 [Daldinia grandis]|nr:hypothetical protein F4814DRAFT_210462 [Daldinia grandis]
MASGDLVIRQTPTRQLHLGLSKIGTLKIVDLPRVYNGKKIPYESPFDILPDELLLAIIKFATDECIYIYGECCSCVLDKETTVALTKVSRRLNRLATPFLYNCMYYPLYSPNASEPLRRIWLPHQQDCRQLTLSIGDPGALTKAELLTATNFIAGCNRVTCLVINGKFEMSINETWELISNILAHMPALKHFAIRKDYMEASLPCSLLSSLMKHAAASKIQALTLYRIGNAGSIKSLDNRDHMATLKDLELLEFEKDGGIIKRLIGWSRHLQSFSLRKSFEKDDEDYMDLAMLGLWLSAHRGTLQKINIGPLSPSARGNFFDLSHFWALKSLELSRHSFSHDLESCESDANLILSPGLEKFYWSFDNTIGFFRERRVEFGEREEKWLKKFVDIAVSKSPSLKTIYVDFEPNLGCGVRKCPWEHLVGSEEYCRQFGITLHCSKPPPDRDQWMSVCSEEPHVDNGRDIREYFTPLTPSLP